MSSSPTEQTDVSEQATPTNSNNINISLLPNIIGSVMPLLTQIYGDLASPSVKKVGQALETVFDLGYTFLAMPLQNASDRRKLIYKRNMELYRKKIEHIEEEDIALVPPELGVPIVQKLTYIESEDIAELFTNLLASASSIRTSSSAHPGYIRIIENLSVDEARISKYLSQNLSSQKIPFIVFTGHKEGGSTELSSRLTGIEKKVNLLFPNQDQLYFDNMTSLGLLNYTSNSFIANDTLYQELEQTYLVIKKDAEQLAKEIGCESLITKKGYYELTDYAISFMNACIKN